MSTATRDRASQTHPGAQGSATQRGQDQQRHSGDDVRASKSEAWPPNTTCSTTATTRPKKRLGPLPKEGPQAHTMS